MPRLHASREVLTISVTLALILRVRNGFRTCPRSNLRQEDRTVAKWRRGYLDIVHRRLGPVVFTYVIFPNGTTAVIDLGELNRTEWNARNPDAETVPHF